MLTERDTINTDGTLNWRALREIAMLRALVEYDAEIVSRLYGPVLRLPAGVSQHNVNEWKHGLAVKGLQEQPTLEHTPFIVIYRRELRRALDAARSVRRAVLRRNEIAADKVVPFSTVRTMDQFIASAKLESRRVS